MSFINPATFAALHPVHHLIFEELVASAPHSVLRLLLHLRTHHPLAKLSLATLAYTATSSPILNVSSLASQSSEQESNPHFPEEGRGPLDREEMLFRRIERLLPSNLREVVFHLDEEGEEYWNKAKHFLHTLAPREAVILIRGNVLNRAHAEAYDSIGMPSSTFGLVGKSLPLSWDGAERLRVFVGSQEGWDSLDYTEKIKDYILPMAISVYKYASNLYDESPNGAGHQRAGRKYQNRYRSSKSTFPSAIVCFNG
ncbi:hypothetical protein I350_08408 [Cryptococcus amylolentus CBS 6273]|uniref:Uncharacterized protein n=1 Tax=Cryptococcus amylolentus CBS 6273 TaxID=1296118 RepID=A0A1E3J3E5_9TREE|nr:hypothetical protein I350_08409 [Cryptococcus amylolentus CBS 6273]ODN95374.1 hypothetical protein I350_08408 [Cryptococcus amylolentus CBS 6273]